MAGKNAQSAESSGSNMSSQGTTGANSGSVQSCDEKKQKHFIGIKVLDEEGKVVKDVVVKGKGDDGTALTIDLSSATLEKDGTFRTKKVLDAANFDFTFPDVFNVEWWPAGGSASAATSTAPVTVTPGDCLLSIADALKFRNYHSIWDQTQNDTLKATRPNANMLLKDDVVNAPDKKDKVETKAVDQVWAFTVKSRKPFKLRMVLLDRDDKPISGKKWELKTPIAQKGTTGGDGLIEITGLKPSDKTGTLVVSMRDKQTAPVKPTPPAPTTPPPYPPVIVADDYKDKIPAPDFTAQTVEWTLSLGALPPVKEKTGTLARLHNLGFGVDVDSDEPKTKRAVKAYQRFYLNNKTGSGTPADIQDDAGTRHDT